MKTMIFIGFLSFLTVVAPISVNAQSPCYSGILSIPASSFQPAREDYSYEHFGSTLDSIGKSYYCQTFYAPLKLPDGAIITSLGMQAGDTSDSAGVSVSVGQYEKGSNTNITTVRTGLSAKPGSVSLEKAMNLTIDNERYSYGLTLKMCGSPDNSMVFYRSKIEYDIVKCPNKVVVIPLGN